MDGRTAAPALSLEDEGRISQLVGFQTWRRGRRYATEGAVLEQSWDEAGTHGTGMVDGSGAEPYHVSVAVGRDGSGRITSLDTSCTCPIGWMCKHAVALIVAGSDEDQVPAPDPEPLAPLAPPHRANLSLVRPGSAAQAAAQTAAGSGPVAVGVGRRATPGPSAPADWERRLRDVLADGNGASGVPHPAPRPHGAPARRGLEPGQLGLQFELVERTPARRGSARATLGVRLRPVTPSTAGNWVRSGVAWTQLDGLTSNPLASSRTRAQVGLLRELRALSHLGPAGRWPGWGEDAVWLESIPSRRLWDVLRHARELGIPLLRAGRDPRPVDLAEEPLVAVTDIVRAGTELELRGRLRPASAPVGAAAGGRDSGADRGGGGEREPGADLGGGDDDGELARGGDRPPGASPDRGWAPDPAAMLLIGAAPHGLVWWEGAPTHGSTPPLHLLPFARTPDAATVELLIGHPITVPAADVDRFEHDVIPRLRRRISVDSSDGSVELPEAPAEAVLLDVSYRPGPAIELRWTLPGDLDADPGEGEGGPTPAGPASDPGDAGAADHGPTRSATRIAGRLAALVRETPWGTRLRPRVTIEAMDAVAFVDDVLPDLLAEASIAVEEHGPRPTFTHVTAAPVIRLEGQQSEAGDWLDLAVQVSVGGEEVPYSALFTALAEGREHLLLPSGTWFALDSPELRRMAELIAEARSLNDAPPGRARLSRYQSSLWEDLSEVAEVGGADAPGWRSAVEALAAQAPAAPVPPDLDATLRGYQVEGFRWLAARYEQRLGAVLADDMGLGKTLQALALILHARALETGARPARTLDPDTTCDDPRPLPWLVVAPTSVVSGWEGEAGRFAPGLRTVAVTRTEAKAEASLSTTAAGADLVLTSYTLFRIDHLAYSGIRWAGVLFDEAQFLKNPASHASQRARRLPAPFKLAMTGTPLENSLRELWAILAVTSPGLLPRADRFDQTYRAPIERQGDEERLGLLRRRIRPLMLRRTKSQVAADLPDKIEQVLELELDPRHRAAYDTHLHRERQKLLGLIDDVGANRFEVLRSLTLLRQAALDITLVDPDRTGVPSTKLDALVELLSQSVAEGHRALVFSQFTRYLAKARRRVEDAGIECCYLDGSTLNRAKVIRRFREGDAPVFLISLKAGGFGLNLTEADLCVLLDPWWNPATEAQAVDRAHRIGQQRKVLVYRMVAKGTIEDKVMALKARKAALFDSVIDAGGFESAALSAEDVRALLD